MTLTDQEEAQDAGDRARRRLKVKNGACRFGKTIFVKRCKVGRKTTRLRLKISFKGNAALSAGSATKTLVVKK